MLKHNIKTIKAVASLLAIFFLAGCVSQKPALNAEQWTYQPNAININVATDSKVNVINGQSHTLLLAVVQTSKLQQVQNYLQNSQGIASFLEKNLNKTDNPEFYVHSFYVSPNERHQFSLTRMAGMKYVIVIAGYNNLNPGQTVKIFAVPIEGSVDGLKIWKRVYEPAKLDIYLHLGEQGIIRAYTIEP